MSTEVMSSIAGPSVSPGATAPLPTVKAAPAQGAPAPDAPKVDAPKAPEHQNKEDPFSSKFAALSRKEKALLEKELAVKEKESKYSEYEAKRGKAKTDPLNYLKEEYGLSLDDLIKLAANDNQPTPEMLAKKALEEVDSWKKQQAEERKKAEEEAKARAIKEEEEKIQESITVFKNEISSFLDSNADKYELTKNHGEGAELVYNVILEHHQKSVAEGNPRVMSIEEAAEAVEKYMDAETDRYLSLKKMQLKVGAKKPDEPSTAEKVLAEAPAASEKTSPKTLTNDLEAQTPPPTDPGRPLSREESRRRAAAMLKWS